jgi:hypothetical protein
MPQALPAFNGLCDLLSSNVLSTVGPKELPEMCQEDYPDVSGVKIPSFLIRHVQSNMALL